MFELIYGDDVLGNKSWRAELLSAFSADGILLLEGHPSFVCLAHREIDHGDLGERVVRALRSWATACEVRHG